MLLQKPKHVRSSISSRDRQKVLLSLFVVTCCSVSQQKLGNIPTHHPGLFFFNRNPAIYINLIKVRVRVEISLFKRYALKSTKNPVKFVNCKIRVKLFKN